MVFVHEVQKKSYLKVPTEEATEAAQILKILVSKVYYSKASQTAKDFLESFSTNGVLRYWCFWYKSTE